MKIIGYIFLLALALTLFTYCESNKEIFTDNIDNDALSFENKSYSASSSQMYLLLSRETRELPGNGVIPVCEIHNQKMHLTNVQVFHYNIETHSSDYKRLKQKYFPNANDPVSPFNSNIYDKYIQDSVKIYVCEECNHKRNEIIVNKPGIE